MVASEPPQDPCWDPECSPHLFASFPPRNLCLSPGLTELPQPTRRTSPQCGGSGQSFLPPFHGHLGPSNCCGAALCTVGRLPVVTTKPVSRHAKCPLGANLPSLRNSALECLAFPEGSPSSTPQFPRTYYTRISQFIPSDVALGNICPTDSKFPFVCGPQGEEFLVTSPCPRPPAQASSAQEGALRSLPAVLSCLTCTSEL